MLNLLRSFLPSETPPTKVLEVKPDIFSERHIICREDGLVLYAPSTNKNDKPKYEIVLHKPYTESLHQTYSLFRNENQADTEEKFIYMKDKIPVFIEIAKDMANIQGLQKVCDILAEHPSWTLAHLAAHFALYDCFNNAMINSYLNSSDIATGMSPLQVAVTTGNLKTVLTLLTAKCSLEHLDHNANSVFHHAATTNKEIISALTQDTPPLCLNAQNKLGYTPLHLACVADKPECVKALLLAGADVNIPAGCELQNTYTCDPGYVGQYLQNNPNTLSHQDMKYGGTPLHWAVSRPVIDALVDVNCQINAVNFQNRTALHVMVMRNKLECVVALLSRGAETDLVDCDGNTALHLTVSQPTDLNLLNNNGESPRHIVARTTNSKALYCLHAVGARRCPPDMQGCTSGCMAGGDNNGEPPLRVIGPTNRDILNQMLAVAAMEFASEKSGDKTTKKGRLLCLDGGGIRGLILVQMLMELETAIRKPIVHCFDWITGTSTGGILALGLAAGKTLRECHCIYFRLKERTFVGLRPYQSEPLETMLKETLGTDTVMSDIKEPKIIIPGVLADRKPVELHLFRNYECASKLLDVLHDSPYELPPPPEETLLWHVARATGAAPTYFRAFDRFLDGGLIANNPTLDALTEIHEYNLALRAKGREDEVHPVSIVISLGTGLIPVTQSNVSRMLPDSIWEGAKLVFGFSALVSLLVDQATMSDGRVVDRARAWCSSIGIPYFRFNPQLSVDVGMDENGDEILCKMLWETKAYMFSNMASVKEVADLLNMK
ncbi:calcium-independent phospholipase a2 [Holotrichia oblita]|uniref:Calcium-independent phospholipase a2 n=1 Tax=Holotrichia oblita TaxID=644536 RepID=A0ACB9TUE9_HOLOL|nr:calcium-independent phospholipase a2 [Holotrichia oblita]